MRIVIDIPKEDYEGIIGTKSYASKFNLIKAMKEAIILPKGHGKLIDVKQIVTKDECIWNSDGSCTTITTYDIDSTSTIVEADTESDDYYRGAQEEY